MDILIALIASLLYFIAIFKIISGLSSPHQIPVRSVFLRALGALTLHTCLLTDLILSGSGQNLNILNIASFISLIIATITTGLMFKLRVWVLLPVVYSFSAINLIAATLLSSTVITHLEAHPKVLVHVSSALFSYSTLMLAALYAIHLAWLDHQLKSKKKIIMNQNLPPLMVVEQQLFNIIMIGEILLTLTLMTGFVFVNDMIAQGKLHKAVLSAIAWIIYGVLLWGHYRLGWRGRPVIWFSIIGAFFLTLAYFDSQFVREVIITE
ncbi:cytochrome C assembly family protein [Candidatus Enterovibrio escicola]|uniref:Glutamate synthase [NADPH] small chain n=1 Tax=Candidatus Enterovibrio escicola TaxID=1927127 RepID=A0A2A5T6A5_9GAMM|nr:inner membrane protein YpjD [Candidatus Enterovibrio escacola]PCS23697.1 Glutamate synthase [NADPH] small chain [Candidatus Enterovibrio escacola]